MIWVKWIKKFFRGGNEKLRVALPDNVVVYRSKSYWEFRKRREQEMMDRRREHF